MTPDLQKFMAFEGLLSWTAAVVRQAERVSTAFDKMGALAQRMPGPSVEGMKEWSSHRRLIHQCFQTERHLFCNAAYQLLQHRRWIKRLTFLDEALFAELDKFAHDIDVMRDMNEHTIEYFEGKGKRPHDWTYEAEGGFSYASSTFDSKLGGRLDFKELGAAAKRLLEKIKPLGPFFPPTSGTPEKWAAHIKSSSSSR